jgi:hypothetical protein
MDTSPVWTVASSLSIRVLVPERCLGSPNVETELRFVQLVAPQAYALHFVHSERQLIQYIGSA